MKKLLPLLLFTIFTFAVKAQTNVNSQKQLAIQWDHTYGGDQDDGYTPLIVQTADSGFLLAGTSVSGISGDKTDSSRGGADYWIIKVDKNGKKLWDRTFGGESSDYLNRVIVTSDNGFLLAGISYSSASGDKTDSCRGMEDFWIVKIDANGNKQWDKTYGGNYQDFLITVRQTKDGGYILGGTSDSQVSIDKNWPCKGDFDWWVVKIDSLGIKQWDRVYGTNDRDDLVGINVTTEGGYILAGESYGGVNGDKSTPKLSFINNDYDAWVIKIDSLGNKIWDKSYGTQQYNSQNMQDFDFVEIANDGGYVFAGGVSMDADSNFWQYWVLKTDTSGKKLWEKTYGGESYGYEGLWQFHKVNDGGFILSGYSQSPEGGSKTENNLGSSQAWVVKIDSMGNEEWDKTLLNNGTYMDYDPSDAIPTLDGGCAVIIATGGGLNGEKTESSKGGSDLWLVKLTDKYNSITGNVYYDFNSNQIFDNSDKPASYNRIRETTTNSFAFTNNNGDYLLQVLSSGNFNVVPENVLYYNSVPYSQPVSFNAIQQKDSSNDFAYQSNGTFNDLILTAVPLTRFRPGNDASYEITYSNVGTTTLSGQVVFISDTSFDFVSSDEQALYSDADSAVWSFSNLSPLEHRKIIVKVHVREDVPIETPLAPVIRVEPIINDETPYNNYAYWGEDHVVTTSLDPNFKTVSMDSLFRNQVAAGAYLDYTVNFQNTGNDTAFIIKILDNLSPLLDINSLEIIEAGHPVNIEYKEASRMLVFEFKNILLPDSNTNERASHGFVRYRIKPLIATVNKTILNGSAIYFDFNTPVLTDTVMTKILILDSYESIDKSMNNFKAYPNPFSTSTEVKFGKELKDAEVVIYNVFGQRMQSMEHINGNLVRIDRENLSSGIYIYEIVEKQVRVRNGKLVVE